MPGFILFGGEIVLLLFAMRLAWWVWQGRRARGAEPPPDPPRGGRRLEPLPEPPAAETAAPAPEPALREAA